MLATDKHINTVISLSVLYILLYTPVWGSAYTSIAAIIAILSTIYSGYLKNFSSENKQSIILILIALTIHTALSSLPEKSVTGTVSVLKGLILYVPAIIAGKNLSHQDTIKYLSYIIALNCIFFLYLLGFIIDWESSYHSIMMWSEKHLGNLHNLNNVIFTTNLAAIVVFIMAKNSLCKILSLLAMPILITISIVVKSEGSTIALYCTLLAGAYFFVQDRYKKAIILLSVTPIVLLNILYYSPDILHQLTGISSNTLNIRSDIYYQLINAWHQEPWFGWGINTYKYIEETATNGRSFLYPHNIYLEALFSLGITGAIILLLTKAYALYKIDFSKLKTSPIALIAFMIYIYISIKGMSDMKFLSQQTIGWFCVCFGLLHGSIGRENASQPTSKNLN
ncbi:MAG: O-antigen ligase family protein [Pontibacterium sp.]